MRRRRTLGLLVQLVQERKLPVDSQGQLLDDCHCGYRASTSMNNEYPLS